MSIATTSRGHAARAPRGAGPTWRSVLSAVRLWRRRARERAELARFSARELRDIGISDADAQREINKPFWRP